eukprot:Tamp_15259.p1 GENE.Tamp_15259~~Tamp_15259.p1  ORF type:complete len:292 (+),score=67.18 Tamp_15259:52-876(+)
MPSMPTKPVSALGNQYVTFNPEQPELFIMRQRIWSSHQPFDVKDIALNDWFKIEGKDAQWTGQKKLVLNTGVPHCYVERKSLAVWHIYVAHERRVTVRREMQDGKQVYFIMLHHEKYPSRTSEDNAGSMEPRLVVTGKFKECNYWFQEFQSREQRRIARVDRNLEDGGGHGKDAYLVQVAASVDVALILLVTMIIDACEHDDSDGNDNYTGRDSTLDSSRTGDDRWRHSLDPVPIQVAGAKPDVGTNKGMTLEGSKVPPLWPKGKGKTPRGAGF